MDISKPYVFDLWRDQYETWDMETQRAFHNELEKQYPDQCHYNQSAAGNAIMLVEHTQVLELGAWKGDLANTLLKNFYIDRWQGIEICTAAIDKTNCTRPEFSYIIPDSFTWWRDMERPAVDLILATHFIEHLSNEHLTELVKWMDGVPAVYLEAPINESGPDNWEGYLGTHKLTMGWPGVKELFSGYNMLKITKDCYLFIKPH